MNINFNDIPTSTMAGLHGGEGDVVAKIYACDKGKVIPCRIQPGASIGLHRHETSTEICYVLYGTGTVICDGKEEALTTDICHICPKGSEHSIVNTGPVELVMLTVVVEEAC